MKTKSTAIDAESYGCFSSVKVDGAEAADKVVGFHVNGSRKEGMHMTQKCLLHNRDCRPSGSIIFGSLEDQRSDNLFPVLNTAMPPCGLPQAEISTDENSGFKVKLNGFDLSSIVDSFSFWHDTEENVQPTLTLKIPVGKARISGPLNPTPQPKHRPAWPIYSVYQIPEWSESEIDQAEEISGNDKMFLKLLAQENEAKKMLAISIPFGNTLYFHSKEHVTDFAEFLLQQCEELFGNTAVPT